MDFKKLNNITGWLVFAIASYVYFATIEPTVSWWDCGEFIATAYKLEIGHPPGAPLFMMLGRIFSLFAFGNETNVALMINSLSALSSAFSILFLFWSITLLARKTIKAKIDKFSLTQSISVLAAGVVGATSFIFCDSFWFSAVEGEVYALSSFFTAFVFWAILKWESQADEPHAERWFILIAYMMGLSIGVHLLNLLAIPVLAYVVYFKKYKKPTQKGFIVTGIVGLFVLVFVQYGIIPGIVTIASKFELLFVNTLGLPFNSGNIFYIFLLLGLVVFGLWYTQKKKKVIFNTIILAFTFILLGYSSYMMIIVRSSANPPMDENDPENVFSLLSYLNREQYGDRPLFYGQQFTAQVIKQEDGKPQYIKGEDKYEIGGHKLENEFEKEHCTVFPRMYSSQPNHIRAYKEWSGYDDASNSRKPTSGENFRFLRTYQIGFMYMRYFLWNFVGRQNDVQGHGGCINGNFISGMSFWDEARLGTQENLPKSMKNEGQNMFYALPLLLGIIGLVFQLSSSQKDTFNVFLLFFMTGLAIIIYLNQYPYQPRERDYAYAGSFYAFSIWIGFSVLGIIQFLKQKISIKPAIAIALIVSLLGGPVIMAADGWDDHDRSNKYTARDYAANYLRTCAKNAILFTNGDNDTFPLWYCQEVEGIRTDVRVVNLALLAGDWYINQMRYKAYESDPLPMTLDESFYKPGKNRFMPIINKVKGVADLKGILDILKNEPELLKVPTRDGKMITFIPSREVRIPVDTAKVIANGTVSEVYKNKIEKELVWSIKKGKDYLGKHELIVMDIIGSNQWERPIYFVAPHSVSDYLNIEDYCQQEGKIYRFVPIKKIQTQYDGGQGFVNTEIMYDNMVNKYAWGNIQDDDVYIDPETRRMTSVYRNMFARLAGALLKEGKKDKAITALDTCMSVYNKEKFPLDLYSLPIIETYYRAGEIEKANELNKELAGVTMEDINYYLALPEDLQASVEEDLHRSLSVFQRLIQIAQIYKQQELHQELSKMGQPYGLGQ